MGLYVSPESSTTLEASLIELPIYTKALSGSESDLILARIEYSNAFSSILLDSEASFSSDVISLFKLSADISSLYCIAVRKDFIICELFFS